MTGRPAVDPEVSVVVPVRNGAAFVAEACRSALAQTGVAVEVIVVENGSTDSTVERVRAMADPRLRLLHQDPPGVSWARNLGIERASAPWVAFLDADDVWAPEKLRRQLDVAGEAQIVFSDVAVVREGVPVGPSFHQVNEPPAAGADLLTELLMRPSFVPLSSVLVQRACVTAAGGFRVDLSHSEDWDLWVRLALAGCTATYVPDTLVMYQVSPKGASRDVRAIYRGEVESLRPLLADLERRGLGPAAWRRQRIAGQFAVIYGRDPGAPVGDRLADLRSLLRSRPSWRSCLAQLAYTVAPSRARRSGPSDQGSTGPGPDRPETQA